MKICTFPDCGKRHHGRGLCRSHWSQQARGNPLTPVGWAGKRPRRLCTFPECSNPHHMRGLCNGHRLQLRRGEELCPLYYPKPGEPGQPKARRVPAVHRMEDYEWLRSQGESHLYIAARMGIKPESLKRALARARAA